MFQKFFTDTIESKFIKSLLRNIAIPLYPTVSDSDFVISNGVYLNKYGIVKYDKSGLASESSFTRISPYVFNYYDKSFTEKYISKNNYYDSETHEKLGNYLRIYRDLNGVDLMPYYNCFSYRFIDDLYLDKKSSNGLNLSNNKLYKVISIPIKFDKTYSIGIDSITPLYFKSILKDNLGLLVSSYRGEEYQITDLLNYCSVYINDEKITNENCYSITSSSYGDIIHYRISLEDVENSYALRLKKLEKYLNLIIQVSNSNNSSITVIEGNHSNSSKSYNVYNADFKSLSNKDNISDFKDRDDIVHDIVDGNSNFISSNIFNSDSTSAFDLYVDLFKESNFSNKNQFMTSDLSLLELGSTDTFAFSDRLVEYLLLNVVDSSETIDNNITRVQNILKLNNRFDVIPSVWSDLLRCSLFKKYMESNLYKKVDINGFVDKDVENLLVRIGGTY